MCRELMFLLFLAFVCHNIFLLYICIHELIVKNVNLFKDDAEYADSILVMQGFTEFFNSLCGLLFVCHKMKIKAVLFTWIFMSMLMICLSLSWEILFVTREKYIFDGYSFNTCVFIKVFGLSSVVVVYNYIREFILISNKTGIA